MISKEKLFEIVDRRRTDDVQCTMELAYTTSSPTAFGSGELKITSVTMVASIYNEGLKRKYFLLVEEKLTAIAGNQTDNCLP